MLLTLAGIVLIALTLRDVFETLFHPLGRGRIGHWVAKGTAGAVGALLPRRPGRALAGPAAFVAVLGFWTALLAVGWALVFLPYMPGGYSYPDGVDPAAHDGFFDALYVSMVNLTSLGYGDITPEASGLRLLGPLETMFGLGLVTASISWLLMIYGVIGRRDAFAHEVELSKQAEERLGQKLADADPALLERMLTSFAEQLIVMRRDLIHFPITDHFHPEEDDPALGELLPFLRRLAEEGRERGRPHGARVRAEVLQMAIEDYEETLRAERNRR